MNAKHRSGSIESGVSSLSSPPSSALSPPTRRRYSSTRNSSSSSQQAASLYAQQEYGQVHEGEYGDQGDQPSQLPHSIPKPTFGRRTTSVAFRLECQGLKHAQRNDYAVRSITIGTGEFTNLIKPFVSDLAFRSIQSEWSQPTSVCFRPYTSHAAILFIDMSGYSKITAAIAHRGAHFLSHAVNSYLEKLLTIIQHHGGDVVKFAGDAVVAVWDGPKEYLGENVLCAASCAVEMQSREPSYTVVEASPPTINEALAFRIHCGIAAGVIESEVFRATTHEHMQPFFHSMGGEPLTRIGEIVDVAKAGEIGVDSTCIEHIQNRGTFREVENMPHLKILETLHLDAPSKELLEEYIEDLTLDRKEIRMMERALEENFLHKFIHPKVLGLLSHGGLTPTQIAQIRNLCVLFIAMTSNSSSVNWLMEVQSILDRNRCPIVQIIDDDKGVHIVAAINLYETVPEASLVGLQICRELEEQQLGSSVGMAMGSTFCGVTGCSSVACRWDITGAPVVRAARLMQFALDQGLPAAIDHSVYNDQTASSHLQLLNSSLVVKGDAKPLSVYGLSRTRVYAAFRVLETVHGSGALDSSVVEIFDHISKSRNRCAVLVTGPAMSGKKVVCQRAAGLADFVPYLHVCDASYGILQLARTVSTWYSFADSREVVAAAKEVHDLLEKRRWCRAHDSCVRLIDLAVAKGQRACFLVDRIQFLDDFSMSLIRESLHRVPGARIRSLSAPPLREQESDVLLSLSSAGVGTLGRICFLMVHIPFYNWRSAEHILEDITRSHQSLQVPLIPVGEATTSELRAVLEDVIDMKVDDLWLNVNSEAAGNCAGYFLERIESLRTLSVPLWKEGKPGFFVISEGLRFQAPTDYFRDSKEARVTQLSANAAVRFTQLYDNLPPLLQMYYKILAVATRPGFVSVPQSIMWEVLNDMVATGVEDEEMNSLIEEMQAMYLIKLNHERSSDNGDNERGPDVVSFQCPALRDIALDVCTPVQLESIRRALVDRFQPHTSSNFKVPFVLADLKMALGEWPGLQKHLWRQGYKMFTEESRSWSAQTRDRWKAILEAEVEGAGFESRQVFGDEFWVPVFSRRSIEPRLLHLHLYVGPIALGPMADTLTLISRNLYHSITLCNGAENGEDDAILLVSMMNARDRYLGEMTLVESFLGFYVDETENRALERTLMMERSKIMEICSQPESAKDLVRKAVSFLDDYIPNFVQPRVERLRRMVHMLRIMGTPQVVADAEPAIRKAYEILSASPDSTRSDAAQTALMVLATHSWKPRPPKELPHIFHQTVASIRNKVLKRLTEAEQFMYKHQQDENDFEAFLVTTPLLHEGQGNE